jgi:hypothetical protein
MEGKGGGTDEEDLPPASQWRRCLERGGWLFEVSSEGSLKSSPCLEGKNEP